MNTRKSRLVLAVAATFATALAGNAHAAFFQLAENSPSGLGNAFAGGAASAEDAATVWYNPAGMTRLAGGQVVGGLHYIKPSIKFSNGTASTAAPINAPISGGNGGDAGEDAFVPNVYYSQQLSERWFVGIGINAPFGLATDYDDGWMGRYHADRSEIMTVNINPAVAYKFNEQFSVGLGINYQKMEASLSQAVDFGTICTAGGFGGVCGPATGNDGYAKVDADDDAWGYNLGFLWQPSAQTRAGVAYRSAMKYRLTGTFDITAPANVPGALLSARGLVDSGAAAEVELPATLSVSAYHQFGQQWAIMGDITRTFWSNLPELRIDFDSNQADSVVTLGLKDVNRYSLGVNFMPGAWTFRAGIAFDETPTPSAELRTARLPDGDRLWLSFGGGYKFTQALSVDVGYTYIKVDEVSINKQAAPFTSPNEDTARGNLRGDYKANTNILSAQLSWKF